MVAARTTTARLSLCTACLTILVGFAMLFCARAGFGQNPPNTQGQTNQNQTTQSKTRTKTRTRTKKPKPGPDPAESSAGPHFESAFESGRGEPSSRSGFRSQITEVLRKQPGLMVELKRWLAADATNHGQVVEDEDLTDQAVVDRIVKDVAFRSIATRLLQRYGYLLPRFNPGSDVDLQDQLHWQAQQLELQREFGIGETSQGEAQQAPTRKNGRRRSRSASLRYARLSYRLARPSQLPIQRASSDQQDLTPGLMRTSAGNPDLQADIQSAAGASGAATGGANIDSERFNDEP